MEQKTIPSTRTYHIVTLDNVIDDDVADTLISATSEPSSPQYTRAITAADLPPNQDVSGFVGLVSIGGRNLNAGAARTINVQFTLNGANTAGNAGNRSITANNYWCVSSGVIRAVQAGDVLGVKMWGSVSNDLDYRYVTIYFLPKFDFTSVGKMMTTTSGHDPTGKQVITGSIADVAYQDFELLSYTAIDEGLDITHPGMLTIEPGTCVMPGQTAEPEGILSPAIGDSADPILASVSTVRYIRIWEF